MNQLDASKDSDANPDGLDFVLQGSRVNLLENKVALVIPEGNPKGIESFDQLAELLKGSDLLMAMGNSDVPVGQYTQKILAFYGLDEEALAGAGLEIVDTATSEMCGQVIYPAAVMKNSANAEAAQAFLDYLKSDEAMAVFESVGFSPAA